MAEGSGIPKVLIIFGAGKIGRSFIAHIFNKNGYRIIFVDIDERLIGALNAQQSYTVTTLLDDGTKEHHTVNNVSAILSTDHSAVLRALDGTTIAATSVGANALPFVAPLLAQASTTRISRNLPPLDCIMAENMRNSKEVMERLCYQEHGANPAMLGLIPACVNKTAPDIKPLPSEDALTVYGDSFNTLYVANSGWKNSVPTLPELSGVGAIQAYLDRKLFIHNLAHVAFSYFAYQLDPSYNLLSTVMQESAIRGLVDDVINCVILALAAKWSREFTQQSLQDYYTASLKRMGNPALKDTIYRIGRDIARKLGREERIVGAMHLVHTYGGDITPIIKLYHAALAFNADNNTDIDPLDRAFHAQYREKGVRYVYNTVSGFNSAEKLDHEILNIIEKNKN